MTSSDPIHATAVAVDGHALVILGPSGAGKSSLAIEMIALGADLIADDMVTLTAAKGGLVVSAPPGARAQIEARHVGIIPCPLREGPVPVSLVVDLGVDEPDRLPFVAEYTHEGGAARLLRRAPSLTASSLLLALRNGGPIDPDSDEDEPEEDDFA